MIRALKSVVSSVIAAAVGLGLVLMVGVVSWKVGSGISGIVLGVVAAALSAQLICRWTSWPASAFAAMLGAGIASFLAIASGEMVEPGSWKWAVQGGLYGATIGLPVSALLSLAQPAQAKQDG